MLEHEALEVRQRLLGAPEREQRLGAQLDQLEPLLLQAHNLRPRELVVAQLFPRSPAPQIERSIGIADDLVP